MKRTIIIIGFVALVIANIFMITILVKKSSTKIEVTTTNQKEEVTTSEKEIFIIEIKGAVKNPGIYAFVGPNVMVNDVIQKAGGLLKNANTSNLNLASLVSNHSSIMISGNINVYSIIFSNSSTTKININTADEKALSSIDEIGAERSKKIIDYRLKNGNFKSIEEIKNVDGIGEGIFEKIKDYITV